MSEPVLHVFIDTNVYLTFFSFADDDLEELRKLHVAINNAELRLWTTEQVQDELRRNRESKVADSIDALRRLKPSGGIPQMARNLPEFGPFLTARRDFDLRLNALDERLSREFSNETLAADGVLQELMQAAETIPVTNAILEAARRRTDLGNPPGKKGSLGDAVNWECLLSACPTAADLYFVTQDSDYLSKMGTDRISVFLASEWRGRKSSEVRLYRRISSLFRDRFPDIELAAELEKELRIRRLIESQSFESTHIAISGLSDYTEFSEQQARDLIGAALDNSQISWIAHDADVQQFFRELLAAHPELLSADEFEAFERSFGPENDDGEPDEIPF